MYRILGGEELERRAMVIGLEADNVS